MKAPWLAFAFTSLLCAGPIPVMESRFVASPGTDPAGWKRWAARGEIAPRMFVDETRYRSDPNSLAISGNSNAAAHGGWEYEADGISPAKWYRFTAYYQTEGVPHEDLQVVARIDWRRAVGKRAGQPDYAFAVTTDGAWKRVTLEAPAPEGASVAKIQLQLGNAPQGTVWWDDVSLVEIDAPAPRKVQIASVNLRPRNTGSAAESVRQFVAAAMNEAPDGTDVILLPEGITIVGTGKKYANVAETIPGPATEALAKLAKAKNAYVSAGIYEREGVAIYNTAVLLDRAGRLVGKYRKMYLPREEVEGGLTPGNGYPVFDTDFGKVGMMICWDVQYADPARALALGGAELLLMPIWGGNETLAKARAIENHVFLAASGYDYPTHIIDPNGEIIALAADQGKVALATIDLNRRYSDKWLGWMRGRFMKELRYDVPVK